MSHSVLELTILILLFDPNKNFKYYLGFSSLVLLTSLAVLVSCDWFTNGFSQWQGGTIASRIRGESLPAWTSFSEKLSLFFENKSEREISHFLMPASSLPALAFFFKKMSHLEKIVHTVYLGIFVLALTLNSTVFSQHFVIFAPWFVLVIVTSLKVMTLRLRSKKIAYLVSSFVILLRGWNIVSYVKRTYQLQYLSYREQGEQNLIEAFKRYIPNQKFMITHSPYALAAAGYLAWPDFSDTSSVRMHYRSMNCDNVIAVLQNEQVAGISIGKKMENIDCGLTQLVSQIEKQKNLIKVYSSKNEALYIKK